MKSGADLGVRGQGYFAMVMFGNNEVRETQTLARIIFGPWVVGFIAKIGFKDELMLF